MHSYDFRMMKNMSSPPYKDSPWLIDLHSHGMIIGMTGTGKSNYLRTILNKLDEEDCNIVLLDPHGEVSNFALMKSTKTKVLLSGSDYPGSEGIYSGINVLKITGGVVEASIVSDWIRQAFSLDDVLSMGTWGPRLETVFGGILLELINREKDLTLSKFLEILPDRKKVLSYFSPGEEPPVFAALRDYSSGGRQWSDFIMSTMNKIIPLVSNPLIRRVISVEGKSALDLDSAILASSNNLIVPELDLGVIGENSVRVISSMILSRIWSALVKKGPTEKRTYILIDEAHMIPESILKTLLAQGRKYGVVLILMYQSLSQNSKQFVDFLPSNIRNYACLSLSRDDAEKMARILETGKTQDELVNVLTRQTMHNVTVNCRSVESLQNADTENEKYGPATFTPPFIPIDFSREDVMKMKAELMKSIGHPDTKIESNYSADHESHSRLAFLFSEFLESKHIQSKIEPNIEGLVPDVLIKYKDKDIFCEIEDSDLNHPSRIAEKMWNYKDFQLMLICRHSDVKRLISIIWNMVDKIDHDQYINGETEKVPRWGTLVSLLKTYIVTYGDHHFMIYNGSEMVGLLPRHFELEGSFVYRARSLPLGIMRETFLQEIAKAHGNIDWDSIESKYGRDRVRKLIENIRDRGYEDPTSVTAILELDKIEIQ